MYKNFNIDWETDVNLIANEDFPIMEDLYQMLEKKAKEKTEHREELETLRAIVRGMAKGESSEIFNGYSNIKIDNSFVCFSISALENADKNVKAAQYLNILRLCENLAFKDRNEKTYVVCDEAYLLISKSHQGIEFLRNFCKRCRKRESGLITITQNLNDFLAPDIKQYGQALLDNSTYKFFFGTDGQDLAEIVRIYNLNQDEKGILSQKEQGRGLLFIGSGHMLINVKALNWEKEYLVGGGR